MEKALILVGGVFILLATVGFLLIAHYLDSKIRITLNQIDENVGKQNRVVQHMVEANVHRESVARIRHSIVIVDALKGPVSEIDRMRQDQLHSFRVSASSLVNAMSAAGLDSNQGQKLIDGIESANKKELNEFYLEYLIKAGEKTSKLQQQIDAAKSSLMKLNEFKNSLWMFCFLFQSAGMLLGLTALFLKE